MIAVMGFVSGVEMKRAGEFTLFGPSRGWGLGGWDNGYRVALNGARGGKKPNGEREKGLAWAYLLTDRLPSAPSTELLRLTVLQLTPTTNTDAHDSHT
jgi:hypothetical protein